MSELNSRLKEVLKHPPIKSLSPLDTQDILRENQHLLLQIAVEINEKKNKNFMPYSVLEQLYTLERNLIRLCRSCSSGQLNDKKVLQSEKQMFQKYYTKRKQRK